MQEGGRRPQRNDGRGYLHARAGLQGIGAPELHGDSGLQSRRQGRAGSFFYQRAYADVPPWSLSLRMCRAIAFFRVLLENKPAKVLPLNRSDVPPIVIASDAQADAAPTGGYLLFDPADGSKVGGVTRFSPAWLELVGFTQRDLRDGANPIGQCEAAQILAAAWAERGRCANRNVIWFADNTSDLHALVKGGSTNVALDRTVQAFHILCCHINCNVWFEYVPSAANWSDGVSRCGFADAFAREQGFALKWAPVLDTWWSLGLVDLWATLRRTAVGVSAVAGSGH